MVKYLLVSLLLFLPYSSKINIDKKFEPYYNKVMEIVNEHCKPNQYYSLNEINFHEMEDTILGTCYIFSEKIYINPRQWDRLSDDNKLQLFFHEMRHCLFWAGHSSDRNNYMYPELDEDRPIEVVKQQFIDDLKKDCK